MRFEIVALLLIVGVVAVFGTTLTSTSSDENKDGLDDRHDLNRDGKPDHGYGDLGHGYADYRYPDADYGHPFVYDHRFYNGFAYGNDRHGYGSPYYGFHDGYHGYRS